MSSLTSIIAVATAEGEKLAATAWNFMKDEAISLTMKAVQLLKETSVGTAIMNMISALSVTTLTGTQKMTAVLSGSEAIYDAIVAAGGLKGLIAEGVSVLRQLAQSLYDDFVQASATAAAALKAVAAPIAA